MTSELTTTYMGMELRSPVIVGSCPLTIEPETVRQLVSAGAGAIVLPSMLQEQIIHASLMDSDPVEAASISGYQPQQDRYNGGAEKYLDTIGQLKKYESVPVIASINGAASGDWIAYATQIQDSGADALELNCPSVITPPEESADQIEQQLVDMVHRVRDAVSMPIAVKLSQRFTNLASITHQLQAAGVDGLVLFSHLPEWDVCVERLHWTVRWELSPGNSLGGILEGLVRARAGGLDLSVAASGGVRTSEDAIKAMIAGADVVMVTSEIYRSGPEAVRRIVEGLHHYLDASPYESLSAFQQSRPPVQIGPEHSMRLKYIEPLTRSDQYRDPTPSPSQETGDSFGHPSA